MSVYAKSEIKYRIDTAIQLTMLSTYEEKWVVLLDVQSRLYEEFGLKD